MGRTYSVPRNVKGETRFLYIFSVKSMITTVAFAALGLPIFLILNANNMMLQGLGVLGIFGAVGYLFGTLKIPDSPLFGNLRKAGGEEISDISFRIITFFKRKKIYVYRPKKEITDVSKKVVNKENTSDEENTNTTLVEENEEE